VNRGLIQKAIDEARGEGANLVIWDERDTFTIEHDDVGDLELSDDYLRAKMQDGKVVVYLELDSIYKLVVDAERARRPGSRAGFGGAGS
jgi:hypothetical protein